MNTTIWADLLKGCKYILSIVALTCVMVATSCSTTNMTNEQSIWTVLEQSLSSDTVLTNEGWGLLFENKPPSLAAMFCASNSLYSVPVSNVMPGQSVVSIYDIGEQVCTNIILPYSISCMWQNGSLNKHYLVVLSSVDMDNRKIRNYWLWEGRLGLFGLDGIGGNRQDIFTMGIPVCIDLRNKHVTQTANVICADIIRPRDIWIASNVVLLGTCDGNIASWNIVSNDVTIVSSGYLPMSWRRSGKSVYFADCDSSFWRKIWDSQARQNISPRLSARLMLFDYNNSSQTVLHEFPKVRDESIDVWRTTWLPNGILADLLSYRFSIGDMRYMPDYVYFNMGTSNNMCSSRITIEQGNRWSFCPVFGRKVARFYLCKTNIVSGQCELVPMVCE